MKHQLLFAFLTIYLSASYAQNKIPVAVPFLQYAPDAASLGLGNTGAATQANANSIHWNTSKIAFSDNSAEIGTTFSNWLENDNNDINYFNVGGYKKLDKRHAVTSSFTFFSINSNATNGSLVSSNQIRTREFELAGGYAFKLSDRTSLGINLKGIYSNLPDRILFSTTKALPGFAMASDLSFTYYNDDLSLKKLPAQLSFGANISNLGNKMTYLEASDRNFLPSNLRLGTTYAVQFKEGQKLTAAIDINKLLVPTPPTLDINNNIISGLDNNVGVASGIIQSFYDAPGTVVFDNTGQIPLRIEKNSRLKEELNEINIGAGLEYKTHSFFVMRLGYFYEHKSKGERQYLTMGFGVFYEKIALDFSYAISTNEFTPAAPNTLLSLRFKL